MDELAEVASELDREPTKAEFTERASVTAAAFYRYYDSWDEVLEAAAEYADEPVLAEARDQYSMAGWNEISREDLFADLRAGRQALGKIPSIPEYEGMGEYSVSSYQNHFGSWHAALVAAFGEDAVPEDRTKR